MVNTTLPALSITPATPHAGDTVQFTFDHNVLTHPALLLGAWVVIPRVRYSDIAADGSTSVPAGLEGTVYVGIVAEEASNPILLTGLAMLNISNATGAGNP